MISNTIYWTIPTGGNHEYWKQVAYYSPELVLKSIHDSRNKDRSFLRCPAFLDFYKNVYVIKSPIDYELTIDNFGNVKTKDYDQQFFIETVNVESSKHDKHPSIVLNFNYIFYSDTSVLIEQFPAIMEDNEFIRNTRIVAGQFDISKWLRPVNVSFEVLDKTKPIVIKKGDPLCYIRFSTPDNKKISLVQEEFDDNYYKTSIACTNLKRFIKFNPLKKNYEMAESTMNFFRKKRQTCPFSFFKKIFR
jgi:hypothetical protein